MHRSSVQVHFDKQAPETLVAFLDGRTPPSIIVSGTGQEPPNKKRKITSGNATRAPLPSAASDDYLTLARVDVSMVFLKTLGDSYPALSSDGRNTQQTEGHMAQHYVLLEDFSQSIEGKYQCRLITESGETLLDGVVHAEIPSRTLEVLRKAIHHPIKRQQRNLLKSTFTVAKSLGFDHDPSVPMIELCVRILVPNATNMAGSIGISRDDLINVYAPEFVSELSDVWSPRDFYDNVHVPSHADVAMTGVEDLLCKLYPFQGRAIQWLLWRERAQNVQPPMEVLTELPHGFMSTRDADGRQCLVSQFMGMATTDEQVPVKVGSGLRGGILAEEMGLGKTVEMVALILLHKQDSSTKGTLSVDALPHSSATLIITPPAILQQWKTELETLAPSLSIFIYHGLRAEAAIQDYDELITRCMQHDVVLTTYNVLGREIHYAESVERNLRHEKRYAKRLSPLTQMIWWRVILDEAQMVESGVSNAAKVAKLVPRQISWCVSGTPVKRDARDLLGLLDFLRYQPYCDLSIKMWNRLVAYHKDVFKQIFRTLALRHTKEQIKDDLQLPAQKRVVVTVPFTRIEEQHYMTVFKQMSEECGLSLDGTPVTEDWDPESSNMIEKMRTWLTRLRQTCLHPEVGGKNRKALGGKGPLRTVGEVLEVMIEQNDTATHTEERALLLSKVRRGQILEHARHSQDALEIWLQALEEARGIVQECRDQLDGETAKLVMTEGPIVMGGSIEAEATAAVATHAGSYRHRLRAAIEIEHMCTFFVANAYFQIKIDEDLTKPGSDKFYELQRREESTYEQAKLLRKELLREAHRKADTLMNVINDKATHHSFVSISDISTLKGKGGIESRSHVDRLEELIIVMQNQAFRLDEWREKTIKLLLLPLVDEEESDLKGDEYENSTKQQDEVYVYFDALRALTADRHDIVTGQENELVKHEMLVAFRQAKVGGGHSPELFMQLQTIRSKIKPSKDLGSIRGMITQLRELKTALRGSTEKGNPRAAAELLIVSSALHKLHQISIEQTKVITGLDREIELFKDTMNLRLEYYRQLQAISDSVAPYEKELTEEARNTILLEKEATERRIRIRIATLKSKARYFMHLRDETANVEIQKICIICQQSFEVGVLTSCGHSYCVECLRLWWITHRNCPTCKKHLSKSDFHQIIYKPQELTMEEEESEPEHKDMSVSRDAESLAIYSGVRDTILNQIKNIDLDGSFGTKIDTLARHMLWIRDHDPGAKSVVFSQYKDFLDVLGKAFRQFKIGFTGFDQKDGIQKFKDDPSKECFFLHARAHSSGLNLVNATHVFLCEPLINTAIELQAIARVHRIGQHQPTTVWMYIVEDTVEKSIYDISVNRRLSLMGRTVAKDDTNKYIHLESNIEAANTLELEQRPLDGLLDKDKRSGEVVGKDDLWNCLFRHRLEQTRRLPEEAERVVARHVGADAAEARLDLAQAGNGRRLARINILMTEDGACENQIVVCSGHSLTRPPLTYKDHAVDAVTPYLPASVQASWHLPPGWCADAADFRSLGTRLGRLTTTATMTSDEVSWANRSYRSVLIPVTQSIHRCLIITNILITLVSFIYAVYMSS